MDNRLAIKEKCDETRTLPGLDISEVLEGVFPRVQVQSGSPSSSPLMIPSPSLSSRHTATVHCCVKYEQSKLNTIEILGRIGSEC